MNPNAIHRRLARLQRECNVSAIPVLLLSASCAVLVLVLALQAGTASAQPAHSAEDTRTFDAAMVEAAGRACLHALRAP